MTYNLEVPDFSAQEIGLSGLTLTSLAGDDMFTPRQDDQLKDVLPAAPVALRTFLQNDELALFAEVYDHSGSGEREVTLGSTVLAADGRVVHETKETIDSSDLDTAKRSYQYSVRLPLSDFAPGRYVLKVEARSSIGNRRAAIRQIGFTVAPGPDHGKWI